MSTQTENSAPATVLSTGEAPAETPAAESPGLDAWLLHRLDLIAWLVVGVGFVVRAMMAAGSYLNPDEALHYLLANQPSVMLAYKASLTNAHPPLVFLLLYFWRFLGNSEFILRLPSLLAGAALLWVAFKWLGNAFGKLAGLIGLFLLTFSPAMISLSAEARGYAVLLLFMASSLYFLERSFEERSPRMMVFFSIFLYLAIFTHYSALWFTLAVGVYASLRIVGRQLPGSVVKVWVGFQAGAVAVYAFLYMTHISKLKGGAPEQQAIGGWLSKQYFHPGNDSLLLFPLRGTVAVFQYVFSQPAAGIAMLLIFLAGIGLLLAKGAQRSQNQAHARDLSILLLLPFVLNCGAAIAGVYPYGGTRHSVFLVLFAVAGVSFLLTQLAGKRIWPVLSVAVVVIPVWNLIATSPAQHISTANQSRILMNKAVDYIRQSIPPGGLLFVDYQSSVMLGYYLGRNQIMRLDEPKKTFLEFPYGGYRVVSSKVWLFDVESFAAEFKRMRRAYHVKPGELVWVVETGWGANLHIRLTRRFPRSYFPGVMFGDNISVLQVPADFEPLTGNLNRQSGEIY